MPQQTAVHEKYYDHIDLDKWTRIRATAARYNLTIDQMQGSSKAFGIAFSWNYDPKTRRLHIVANSQMALLFITPIIEQA